jgi:DNA primase catalytic core
VFAESDVRRVVESTDLVQLVSGDREVSRAGGKHTCCCWVHQEKTPSMVLYGDGSFHCFGCGAHGDVVDYVRHRDACDFPQAIETLARAAGIALQRVGDTPARQESRDRRARLQACLHWAAGWFRDQMATDDAQQARDELTARGFDLVAAREAGIGYAPGLGRMLAAAAAAGWSLAELRAVDLAVDIEGRARDRYYRRIMLPIGDAHGHPRGFVGRRLEADREKVSAKYVNTGDTELYTKGAQVYGLHRAAEAARAEGAIVLVEGPLDALAGTQLGRRACVASLGTALTEIQAAAIAKASARAGVPVVLLPDGDEAGQVAAERSLPLLLAAGCRALVGQLARPSKDLGDLVAPGVDDPAAQLRHAIATATPALPWLARAWWPEHRGQPDAHQRLALLDRAADLLGTVSDEALRRAMAEDLAAALGLKLKQILDRHAARSLAAGGGEASEGAGGRGPSKRRRAASVVPPPTWDAPPSPDGEYECNELGNAHRFAARYGDRVRYCHTWQSWLLWRGTHWATDTDQQVARWMAEAIDRGCRDEAARARKSDLPDTVTEARIDELDRWRLKSLNHRALSNSEAVAQSLSCLAVIADQLDAHHHLFACKNGVIDLLSGELLEHDPNYLQTRCCPVDYRADARDARWERFLADLVGGDQELLAYLQRLAGYGATGDTSEEAVPIFVGPGGAGKSTFTSAVLSILGSYGDVAPFDIFLQSQQDRRRWTLAKIEKARLVVCEESREGAKFASDILKLVTGGTPIEAEAKGKQPYTYRPRFKLWFVTNTEPWVSDVDSGFWRRCRLIRCDHVPAEVDLTLKDHLADDRGAREAILAWIVAGAAAWCRAGRLGEPECVIGATRTYRDGQDPLAGWLTERTVWSAGGVVARRSAYNDYRNWCDLNGQRPISPKAMGQRLRQRGASDSDSWIMNREARRSERAWAGFRLREDDIEDEETVPANVPQLPGNTSSAPRAATRTSDPPKCARVSDVATSACVGYAQHAQQACTRTPEAHSENISQENSLFSPYEEEENGARTARAARDPFDGLTGPSLSEGLDGEPVGPAMSALLRRLMVAHQKSTRACTILREADRRAATAMLAEVTDHLRAHMQGDPAWPLIQAALAPEKDQEVQS